MPLSLNEIKDRALAFSREWEGAKTERAESQTFWSEFFNVFGISRRRLASFEGPVKKVLPRYVWEEKSLSFPQTKCVGNPSFKAN